MIKSVTITNYLGERVKIDLFDQEPSHGFLIRSISGLGPAKANINMADLATTDGSLYNSARVEKRNIILQLIFTDANSIEDSRQRTYKFFHIKKNVEILIETDNRTLYTTGYIESNEPDIFSKQEGCQISVVCEDPYFYMEGKDVQNAEMIYGTDAFFEFPFENNSLTEPLIEFGEQHFDHTEGSINYKGDAEVGMVITISAVGDAGDVVIRNADTLESMYLHSDRLQELTGSRIISGDVIVINTTRGNKSIFLLRNGESINILNCLDRNTAWLQLSSGLNNFVFQANSGLEHLQFKMEYLTRYEGI